MLDNETKLVVSRIKMRLDMMKKAIAEDKDVTFICLMKIEGEQGFETFNFGDAKDILSASCAQIESLISRVGQTGESCAEGIDLVIEYFKEVKKSFLDGSFDGRSVPLDFSSPDGCVLPIIDGGEQ